MKICIVSYLYPSKYNSADFVFVKNLVDEFARQGHECVVVSPFWTMKYKHISKGKSIYQVGRNKVTVLHPNFISASNLRIGSIEVSAFLHKMAVKHALNKMDFSPDVMYCHFWKQGLEAFSFAKKRNIPLFVATGECEIFVNNQDGFLDEFRDYVSGVICVSTKNKEESLKLGLTTEDKCSVIPNSIDNSLFKLHSKDECRKKIGIPSDKYVVAFVGSFIDRKGTMRVSRAIDSIKENNVFAMFIGSGSEDPNCKNILYKGKVSHDELPIYLNAADVFVLPTLQEGCCNAIIEAMACGLPIISSDLSFNWDVLNFNNSIMIDPLNEDQIRDAIITLRDNEIKRLEMSNASLISAQSLNIEERAKKIIEFIKRRLK